MKVNSRARNISAVLVSTSLFACGGSGGSGNTGSCVQWIAHVPDALTINKGDFDVVTFVPTNPVGITIVDGFLSDNATTALIGIEQLAGNDFRISVSPAATSGTYTIQAWVETSAGVDGGCQFSEKETIVVTIP